MKVIFLDIDGVLNTSETFDKIYKKHGFTNMQEIEIDEYRLEYLKNIIDETDAKIVLSSSFRHFFIRQNDTIVPGSFKGQKLYELFLRHNIEIFDTTPNTIGNREDQIMDWLKLRDDIDDFVIIDDDKSMFYNLFDKLIQTNITRRNYLLINESYNIGLCEFHVDEIVNKLNSKNKVLKK